MSVIVNLLLIAVSIIYMIDLSGFVDEMVKRLYYKYIKVGDYHTLIPKLKPLSCASCLNFWVGTIYILATGTFTMPLFAYVCMLSFFSTTIGDILVMIKDALNKIINLIYKLID